MGRSGYRNHTYFFIWPYVTITGNHEKLAEVIIDKIAKKIVLFHFQFLFTHSKFDNSATSRQKHDFCSILKLFSKAKQMIKHKCQIGEFIQVFL
jgi:hypothetical protein